MRRSLLRNVSFLRRTKRATIVLVSASLAAILGIAAYPSLAPQQTAALAREDQIKPEWRQEHEDSWTSVIGGKTYKHFWYSRYDDSNNLVGTNIYSVDNDNKTSHVKWTFYRSDQPGGYKKGTLVVEPTSEEGLMSGIASELPWKDEEVKANIKRIVFKAASINGKLTPVTLDKIKDYMAMFMDYRTLEIADLRGLVFKYADGDFSYENCKTRSMFENDLKLHTIILNPTHTFDRSSDFSRMFKNCWSLSKILCKTDMAETIDYEALDANKKTCDLSGLASFNTKRCTTMYAMFETCYRMTDFRFADYPNFDTAKVARFEYMFSGLQTNFFGHKPLEQVDSFTIKNGELTAATGNFNLKKLDLSTFDTSAAVDMEGMFIGQEGLEELNISGKFNMKNINSTDNMFRGAHSLSKLTIDKNFSVSNYSGLEEPNDSIFNAYTKQYFTTNNTGVYSGKWVPEGIANPTADQKLTSMEFWNSKKLSSLLQNADAITMVWEQKAAESAAKPQVSFVSDQGDIVTGSFVKVVSVGDDNKLAPADIPTKLADGREIEGWYKQGDANKTKLDLATITFNENTVLMPLVKDAENPGGGSTPPAPNPPAPNPPAPNPPTPNPPTPNPPTPNPPAPNPPAPNPPAPNPPAPTPNPGNTGDGNANASGNSNGTGGSNNVISGTSVNIDGKKKPAGKRGLPATGDASSVAPIAGMVMTSAACFALSKKMKF